MVSAVDGRPKAVIQQLYSGERTLSFYDLLEDKGLAPLTKVAQRWIWEQQHPDPSTCTEQQYAVVGGDLAGNGLGSVIHVAGEGLSAALQHGWLFVWHEAAGQIFMDPGCGRGEKRTNMECLFERPSSCAAAHASPDNSLPWSNFQAGGAGFPPHSNASYVPNAPAHLANLVRARLAAQGVDPHKDFLKYWWRSQSAAYLARPNVRTRHELLCLRTRPDAFVALSRRRGKPPPFPLPAGAVHVHVRHGNKGGEMTLLQLEEYLKKAEEQVININPLAYKKYAFLSTDDSEVFRQAEAVTRYTQGTTPDGDWVIFASNDNRTSAGGQEWTAQLQEFGRQSTVIRHLLNLFVALECDAFLGTRGSNWDRLVDELRCTWVDKCTQPYVETELSWLLDDALASLARRGEQWQQASWRSLERDLQHSGGRGLGSLEEYVVQLREPLEVLDELWAHRLERRVPLQYLCSAAFWRDMVLSVGPGVLIPRPETELLIDFVEAAVEAAPALATGQWVDLGTGSGALAVGLARALPRAAAVWAVDAAEAPLAYAAYNAARLGVGGRVRAVRGCWYEPLLAAGVGPGQLAGILSNPPYILTQDLAGLQAEVGRHEPRSALDGGEGLAVDCLIPICTGAVRLLQPGGLLALETGGGEQALYVADVLRHMRGSAGDAAVSSLQEASWAGSGASMDAVAAWSGDGDEAAAAEVALDQQPAFTNVQVRKDLYGVDRFVTATRAGP
eukprot:scaffold1.g5641.t1